MFELVLGLRPGFLGPGLLELLLQVFDLLVLKVRIDRFTLAIAESLCVPTFLHLLFLLVFFHLLKILDQELAFVVDLNDV